MQVYSTTPSAATSLKSGFSTLEILLAFSVGMLFLTSALMVIVAASDSGERYSLNPTTGLTIDALSGRSGVATLAFSIASTTEALKKNWYTNFLSAIRIDQGYAITPPTVTDISPCLKSLNVTSTWDSLNNRTQKSSSTIIVSNPDHAIALGLDCEGLPLTTNWAIPTLITTTNFASGTAVAMDVLNYTTYMSDSLGNLHITDQSGDTLTPGTSFTPTPLNGGAIFSDIDVAAVWDTSSTNDYKRYAFTTRLTSPGQLQVIDVTDPNNPTSTPAMTASFLGVNPPHGSYPQGWRVFYYNNFLYALTRETAGFEFHIFDVNDPTKPLAVGPGFELNGTANDLSVTDFLVSGVRHTVVFLATERSALEIMVLDVTNPNAPRLLTSVDLPGTEDALSLHLIGNRLYVGRQRSATQPELLVFDLIIKPTLPLALTLTASTTGSSSEVNADVTSIRVTEELVFITTSTSNDAFQIFTTNLVGKLVRKLVPSLTLSGRFPGGLDYSYPYLFLASNTDTPLMVIKGQP